MLPSAPSLCNSFFPAMVLQISSYLRLCLADSSKGKGKDEVEGEGSSGAREALRALLAEKARLPASRVNTYLKRLAETGVLPQKEVGAWVHGCMGAWSQAVARR